MKKFIIGFLLGTLIFGGILSARENLVDFSEDSIPVFDKIIRKIWFEIDNLEANVRTATFWVEENAALSIATEGGLQFSWGNGAMGNWGAYQPVSGKVLGMSLNCDTDTSDVDSGWVEMALNGSAQGASYRVTSPGAADSGNTVTFTTPLSFSAGDRLTAITTQTPTGGGSCTDVIIMFWVIYDI